MISAGSTLRPARPRRPRWWVAAAAVGGDRHVVTRLDEGMSLRVIEIAAEEDPVVRPDGSVELPGGAEQRVGDVVSVVAPDRGLDCDLDEFPPFGPPQG